MVDTLSPEKRSELMSLVRNKDTRPEMVVRRLVYGLGYRYRLHGRNLPGRPDLVFKSRKKVIFVHGCFWHGHGGCKRAGPPKSHLDFWLPKLEGNKERDERNQRLLEESGWRYIVIWECETNDADALTQRITDFLAD